jgi:hypothetical protein
MITHGKLVLFSEHRNSVPKHKAFAAVKQLGPDYEMQS